jgi:hypothetical protein
MVIAAMVSKATAGMVKAAAAEKVEKLTRADVVKMQRREVEFHLPIPVLQQFSLAVPLDYPACSFGWP